MNLDTLKTLNPTIDIKAIHDPAFSIYGQVIDWKDFLAYQRYLEENTQVPETLNQYIADDPKIHELVMNEALFKEIFGHTQLQYGYVNGNNSMLNALEWHPSPEINLALTPLVLLLGQTKDINDHHYDVKRIQAFYLPAQTAIIIYPTTLHFSPFKVSDEGFKCGVILPYGTNMTFTSKEEKIEKQEPLLFKTNKWLIAHPDNKTLLDLGAYPGLTGENLKVIYKG